MKQTQFVYDGDGARVNQSIVTDQGEETTYFVRTYYEVTGEAVTKYYYAGGQRIAMRADGNLAFLLGDHLGSTSLTTDGTGNVLSETRYTAWGEVRFDSGDLLTEYTYTGQYSYAGDFGLMFYNARWYDAALGRFAQADSIVPLNSQGVQALDRYAYVNNNPVKYSDPSGHGLCSGLLGDCRTQVARPVAPAGMTPQSITNNPVVYNKLSSSGKKFVEWYSAIFEDKSGWWHETFRGGFTIWDAMAAVMVREAQNNWDNVFLGEAMVRSANEWCHASTGASCTLSGYINWFIDHTEIARKYVSGRSLAADNPYSGLQKIETFDQDAVQAMNQISSILMSPNPDWKSGCDPIRPCSWGNLNLYPESVQLHLYNNVEALFVFRPYGDTFRETQPLKSWIIPSGCAARYWMDANNRNLGVTCESVRE